MNFISILLSAAIVLLLGLAIRYIVKKGPCAACADAKNCRSVSGESGCTHCPGNGCCHNK